MQLEFDDFDLEASNTCAYDYVEIYEAVDADVDVQLVDRYCGSSAPSPISSDSNLVTIKFSSDGSVRKRGFKITWTITGR